MPALLSTPARMRLAHSACRRATPTTPTYSRLYLQQHQQQQQLQQPRPFSASTTRHNPTPNPQTQTTATTATTATTTETPLPPPPPARWITDLRARIGKCLVFGCNSQQISQAAGVLRVIATEWRELLAGSEGYLTGGRRGLDAREVVWGEMDSFGHVNNVNYYRYAESARVNWITNFAVHVDPQHREQWAELMSPKSTGLIMRSLKADFKFPMVYPDKISVYHKLRSKPEGDPAPSSFYLDCIVLSHQQRRMACRLEEDIVIYDYKKAGKTSMPGFMLGLFEKTWQLQEQATVDARTRIFGLQAAVERLENETWNRADAVEDMGGSKGSK